jgi:hypothetical protein
LSPGDFTPKDIDVTEHSALRALPPSGGNSFGFAAMSGLYFRAGS